MARRKRASMREGPLADLFRSTVEPDEPPEAPGHSDQPPPEEETSVMRQQAPPPPREPAAPEPRASEQAPAPFDQSQDSEGRPGADPERVRAYRLEDDPPRAKERLSRVFTDDSLDVEG